MNVHEIGFLDFLAEPGRRRMRTLIALGAGRRRDLRSRLQAALILDPRYRRPVPGSQASPWHLDALLRAQGAPPLCYVMAADPALDGRELPLRVALDAIVGQGDAAFVSCLPGRLGFFEYAAMKAAYLLSR